MKFKSKMNIKLILQKTGAKLPKGTKKKTINSSKEVSPTKKKKRTRIYITKSNLINLSGRHFTRQSRRDHDLEKAKSG